MLRAERWTLHIVKQCYNGDSALPMNSHVHTPPCRGRRRKLGLTTAQFRIVPSTNHMQLV